MPGARERPTSPPPAPDMSVAEGRFLWRIDRVGWEGDAQPGDTSAFSSRGELIFSGTAIGDVNQAICNFTSYIIIIM